jgi:hypothetical protein
VLVAVASDIEAPLRGQRTGRLIVVPDGIDADQLQSELPDPAQEAMELRLVDDQAGDGGLAAAAPHRHPFERRREAGPSSPATTIR